MFTLLAACASMDSELAAARDSWRGATYEQMVAAWGQPDRIAGDSYTWLFGAQRSGGGAGGAVFADACERTLVIRDARVVRAGDWKGASESCKGFARK